MEILPNLGSPGFWGEGNPTVPPMPTGFSSKKIAGPHFQGLLGNIKEKSSLKALFFFWVSGIVGVVGPLDSQDSA